MGLLSWIYSTDPSIKAAEEATPPGPGDDFWYEPFYGSGSNSGVNVTPDTAMRATAVQACVRVLAETLATLPLKIYERLPDRIVENGDGTSRIVNGGKKEATNHPLWDVLHSNPNSWQTSFEWREMMMGHIALRGNAYSEIVPGPRGFADKLIPLHPDRVQVKQLENLRLVYEYTTPQGQRRKFTQDEILHLRLLSTDGILGLSPITMARESIGLSLATERYGARFFKNNATPGGIIMHPGILEKDGRENLKRSWQAAQGGSQQHSTAVLEEGMKWEKIGMTSEDAQFLETRKFQIADIARVFRVPPHMIGDLEKATFNNIEELSRNFVLYTMMPHAVRWESGLERDLILNRRRFFIKFNFNSLLRGNTKVRIEALNKQIAGGWLTRNEARDIEDMNPLPGLDEPLQAMNMGNPGGAPDTKETDQQTEDREDREDPEEENNAAGNGHRWGVSEEWA